MGKVIGDFTNGWPGAVSRSIDNVIIAMKNGTSGHIPFGVPVFFYLGDVACCKSFDSQNAASFSADGFLGFTVRSGIKTPEEYGSNEAVFTLKDPVEILVRGSMTVFFEDGADPGSKVYIRKSDGVLVTEAGTSGSTLELPNVRVRTASDDGGFAEIVILKRNLM
jgi:hypothetical protein